MEENLLTEIYREKAIFIQDYSFDDKNLAIQVTCKVIGESYTIKPIPYVSTENYVRCMSQACYLLADHLLENKLIKINIPTSEFKKAAIDYRIFYRSISMMFHQQVDIEKSFDMKFQLKNIREIKRIQDYVLFTFENNRIIITGEMTFVFVNEKSNSQEEK